MPRHLSTVEPIPELFARHLSRAVGALKLGDQLVDTLHPARREEAVDAGLAVYGQGLFWGLTAEASGALPESLSEAWAGASPELFIAAADPATIDRAGAALGRDLAQRAGMSEVERIADLTAVRALLAGLIRTLRRRQPPRARLKVTRWTRITLLAGAALVVLAVIGAKLLKPKDLAAGMPWSASSVEPTCDPPNGMCAGAPVAIFFHTRQEESPWVRIDLLLPQKISTIVVRNRNDCCQDRAIPLVLEVSTDGKRFTKVAENSGVFHEWKAKFAPVTARYVRARVPRNTILHLEKISVR